MSRSWLTAIALALSAQANAQPAPATPQADPPGESPGEPAPARASETQPDWSNAPPPDQASGIERPEAPRPAHHLLRVTRAVLFVPRWIVWGVAQPVRAGAYVYERYNLPGVFRRTFFSVDQTFGVYPTGTFESGFGVTVGGRIVHRDLFGKGERIKLRAGFGGRFRQALGVNLRSGRRLGPVALELDLGLERRPQERFFGIGNADLGTSLPAMPVDPTSAAYSTRFREDMVRGSGRLDVRLGGGFEARVTTALTQRILEGTGDPDSLEMTYDTRQLTGWTGVENVRTEAELVYDSRRPTSPYQTSVIDATGWYVDVHAGVTRGVYGDPSEFEDYGVEIQRFIDLYRGSRVLGLRLLVEAVDGPNVSFLDLPRLGGVDLLRGYPASRFRDRAIGLASIEYTWDLGNFLAAYTFLDVGRTWRSLDAASVDFLRVGYGGGVQLHTMQSYLGRAQVAASRDGDVFVELVLQPVFARRERVGRP